MWGYKCSEKPGAVTEKGQGWAEAARLPNMAGRDSLRGGRGPRFSPEAPEQMMRVLF